MRRKQHEKTTTEQPAVDAGRRQILGTAPFIAAASLLWKPTSAAAGAGVGRGSRLVVDVACLGNTLALDFAGALDAAGGDLRGTSFYVEGALYPAGTIPMGAGFDPAGAMMAMMGHWLCRGWFMLHPGRLEPTVITTQEYLLQVIDSAQAPSPKDTLVSSGVEGTFQFAHRAIIGGSGQYRHARGEVVQEVIGTNATILNGIGDPAPNFRFHFDF